MKSCPENFVAMRDRLMTDWGWDRKVASVAVRYYNGAITYEDVHQAIPSHAQEVIDAR